MAKFLEGIRKAGWNSRQPFKVCMSAIGTKRTSQLHQRMSAFGGKADMHVLHCKCPLLTQSGHSGWYNCLGWIRPRPCSENDKQNSSSHCR